jgi:hypothetical protein
MRVQSENLAPAPTTIPSATAPVGPITILGGTARVVRNTPTAIARTVPIMRTAIARVVLTTGRNNRPASPTAPRVPGVRRTNPRSMNSILPSCLVTFARN